MQDRKIFLPRDWFVLGLLGVTLLLGPNPSALAAESPLGGLEFSGHVDVVTGWQQDDASTLDFGSCSFGIGGLGCNAVDSAGSGYGELGNFRGLGTPNRSTFNFYLDEVELDLNKSFGEYARIRVDLDMGRFLSGTPDTGGFNDVVEQGYVTYQIPFFTGVEMAVGRFNIPMGYESVDRIDNVAVSFSNIYRYVRPHNGTGLKLYQAFNPVFDISTYVVNSLSDTFSFAVNTDSALPSSGIRFGFTFGPEGQESTLGFSFAWGPENWGHNAHLTYIFDLDFQVRITPELMIAGEGIYRQDNTGFVSTTGFSFVGFPNSKVWGGNVLVAFSPSEVFDLWFRGEYLHDIDITGAYTGLDQQISDYTLGFGYNITDAAKFKVEFRADWRHYASTQLAGVVLPGGNNSLSYGLAGEFGYQF